MECYRREEIDEVVTDTFKTVKLLSFRDDVEWQWNHRLKSSLGRANYTRNILEFSSYLWPYASINERKKTVIHEVCHLAAMELFKETGHGEKWKHLMMLCGQSPDVRHSVGAELNRKRVYCGCSAGCTIGKIRYRKMLLGKATYACNICNEVLRTKP